MAIEVQCGGCGKRYSVGDAFAGKKARCKACGNQMVVPQPAAEPDLSAMDGIENSGQVDESAYQPTYAAPVAAAITPPPVTRFPVGASPLPSAVKKSGGSGIGFRINRIVIILLVLGGMVAFWGFKEMRLASVASGTPQSISCEQLEKNGPGANAYVTLNKFLVSPGGYIYQYKHGESNWQQAWVPVVPSDGAYVTSLAFLMAAGQVDKEHLPKPKNVKVLIRSTHIKGESDVAGLTRRGSVVGMVVNQVESLAADERKHLQSEYPDTDFDKCWIVEEGREPAPPGKYLGMMGGGAALILAGLFFMLKPN